MLKFTALFLAFAVVGSQALEATAANLSDSSNMCDAFIKAANGARVCTPTEYRVIIKGNIAIGDEPVLCNGILQQAGKYFDTSGWMVSITNIHTLQTTTCKG